MPILINARRSLVLGNVAPSIISNPSISLPIPSFGSQNLVAWFDSSQFSYTDNIGYNTVSAMEDLSGNGFSLYQPDKSLQPIVGASGGPTNNGIGVGLIPQPGALGWINGYNKISVWARVRLRSDLYIGSAKRTVVAISEAATTSTPPGSGSGVERFAIYLTGGTTGRRLYSSVSVRDGVVRNTSTTLGPQLANDVFATVGIEIDLSGAQASIDLFHNSTTSSRNELWTPAESTPWIFNTSDSVVVRVLENQSNNSPLYGEMRGMIVLADVPNSTRRQQIFTYLNGLN